MKRVQTAVGVLVAVAIFGGTPAQAAKPRPTNLMCMVTDLTDPDYGASGAATFTLEWSYFDTYYGNWEQGNLRVSCRGLTPGVTYTVFGFYDGPQAFTAKPNGNASVAGWVGFWNWLDVWVVREDGTLILAGTVY